MVIHDLEAVKRLILMNAYDPAELSELDLRISTFNTRSPFSATTQVGVIRCREKGRWAATPLVTSNVSSRVIARRLGAYGRPLLKIDEHAVIVVHGL